MIPSIAHQLPAQLQPETVSVLSKYTVAASLPTASGRDRPEATFRFSRQNVRFRIDQRLA
jgi:hypothetical protein